MNNPADKPKGLVIVLSAPSGGGKSTLIRELKKKISGLAYSVSVTTRPPRSSEKNGKDYYFVSEPHFLRQKKAGQFLECARVHDHWYGTPKKFILQTLSRKKDILLDIDIQGGKQIKKKFPQAILIFVLPPSFSVLERRLRRRNLDDEKTIRFRLRAAHAELSGAKDYDYLIVNQKLSQAVEHLKSIIISERLRMFRNPQKRFITGGRK